MDLLEYYRHNRNEIEVIAAPHALFLLGFLAEVSGRRATEIDVELKWSPEQTDATLTLLAQGGFLTKGGSPTDKIVTTSAGRRLLQSLGFLSNPKSNRPANKGGGAFLGTLAFVGVGIAGFLVGKLLREATSTRLSNLVLGIGAGVGIAILVAPELKTREALSRHLPPRDDELVSDSSGHVPKIYPRLADRV